MKKARTYKNLLFTLSLISIAPVFLLIFFSVIVVFLHNSGQLSRADDLREILLFIVPIFSLIGLTSAYLVYKFTINKINASLSLREKLLKFQSAIIVRMAMWEAVGLFGAVAAFLTGDFYFLLAPLLVTILFILLRPTAYLVAADLNLSQDEKGKLESHDAVFSEN